MRRDARYIDSALVRRVVLLVLLACLAAGCSKNRPGEKIVAPLPSTVVGTVPKQQQASVPAQYQHGDSAAGKQVFETAGCKGCHTLKDAGATGTVGPNLDEKKPSAAVVVRFVTIGKKAMPPYKGTLSAQQIQDVASYVSSVAGK